MMNYTHTSKSFPKKYNLAYSENGFGAIIRKEEKSKNVRV